MSNARNAVMDKFGNSMVALFHRIALFGIGAATIWAAGVTFVTVFMQSHASIGDLLLLFIYLEIGAMVGIYFETNHMPVRFLLYIAITALTRHMVDIMSHSPININEMIAVAVSTLLISISVLIVRYTSARFPSKSDDMGA
ncbi:MAG: phosphate-starvation-inducible protein PsiE [Burkholderiaceae bacterium]|jgi:phosphate starvation-inducible membrane PsiE|nr:phosphate-starvation-inducible protein PsiE [Burkholderiaceae bacterium]MBU6291114.1 phosphate-starvation-inducible PsiE family protein [Burkholderiales bacterium]NDG07974.1 phosphate-starvation-inducible protein PsiE [Oxalobacteraceae bacterium]